MKNHICYIEIPADDLKALQAFYTGLFGWTYERFPADVEYYGVKHGEEKPGVGMMARQHPQQMPIFYVCVDSVAASVEKATGLGATVIVPRTAVPKLGWFAVLMDTDHNPFGLWEDDTNAA